MDVDEWLRGIIGAGQFEQAFIFRVYLAGNRNDRNPSSHHLGMRSLAIG